MARDTSNLRPLTPAKAIEFCNRLKGLALRAIDADVNVYMGGDGPEEFTIIFGFAEAGMLPPSEPSKPAE